VRALRWVPSLSLRSLYLITLNRPFTLPLGAAAVVVGCLALYHGTAVSAALSIITPETVAPAGTITRFWGLLQVIGGVQVLRGVLAPRLATERNGWSFLIGAHLFYSVGLIGGLGLAGSAAGTYLAALAIGSALRTWGLKQVQDAAKEAERSREDR
jgi:hypothetical protein